MGAMEGSTSDGVTASTSVLAVGHGDAARTKAALQRRRRRLAVGLWLCLVAAQAIASVTLTLPYYELAPGSARQLNDLISVPKDLRYPPRGEFLLTTVALDKVHPLDAIRGWLDPDIDVVPERDILGPTPPKNFTQQGVQEMDESKQTAEVVALRRIGSPITESGAGALIVSVQKKAPADGHLLPGDVVTAVDGKTIHLRDDLVSAIAPHKFGDVVKLTATTGDQPSRIETLTLGGSSADKSQCSASSALTGKGCMGVTLTTKSHAFDGPLLKQVAIDTPGIGGPSAGLAFTLALIDELRPGELTGGRKIAVTGTINLDETVGDVGGVVQKTAAVRRSGAEVFLVPPEEYKVAKAHAGKHLQVIEVRTLDDALAALGRLGGDVSGLVRPAGAH
jgi:Lon-like protease